METRMNTPKVGTSTTINLRNKPEFKLTIGSENKKEPKVVYFFLSSWITSEEPITKEIVNKINKRIRQSLYDKNDFQAVLNFLDKNEYDFESIITHKLPISETQKALELMLDQSIDTIKILLY